MLYEIKKKDGHNVGDRLQYDHLIMNDVSYIDLNNDGYSDIKIDVD